MWLYLIGCCRMKYKLYDYIFSVAVEWNVSHVAVPHQGLTRACHTPGRGPAHPEAALCYVAARRTQDVRGTFITEVALVGWHVTDIMYYWGVILQSWCVTEVAYYLDGVLQRWYVTRAVLLSWCVGCSGVELMWRLWCWVGVETVVLSWCGDCGVELV